MDFIYTDSVIMSHPDIFDISNINILIKIFFIRRLLYEECSFHVILNNIVSINVSC